MNKQFCKQEKKQTTLFRSVHCIWVQGFWSYKYGLTFYSVLYITYYIVHMFSLRFIF